MRQHEQTDTGRQISRTAIMLSVFAGVNAGGKWNFALRVFLRLRNLELPEEPGRPERGLAYETTEAVISEG